eukprot:CAMPEP_0206238518 /NCGR_PEP_ID=MMETSP0047_2-20121206/14862_1 /ASSEMBLY_ACC=CAM_ASM_000192 /TAXON_ID=195065 /ORGANISM="Chroomonas mesostigmatica_cf, Strain CCMP1168" /LENGTH=242 /DNA_ID=CAMNT_0053663067 /DNA_START=227 /DNA_END=952 /DNA_ORIENTATION=-
MTHVPESLRLGRSQQHPHQQLQQPPPVRDELREASVEEDEWEAAQRSGGWRDHFRCCDLTNCLKVFERKPKPSGDAPWSKWQSKGKNKSVDDLVFASLRVEDDAALPEAAMAKTHWVPHASAQSQKSSHSTASSTPTQQLRRIQQSFEKRKPMGRRHHRAESFSSFEQLVRDAAGGQDDLMSVTTVRTSRTRDGPFGGSFGPFGGSLGPHDVDTATNASAGTRRSLTPPSSARGGAPPAAPA